MSFLKRIFGGGRADTTAAIDLPSSKYFPTEVAGEGSYQPTLERICGGRTEAGEDRILPAALVLEDDNPHDANAVRVEIKGKRVGYLPREVAPIYRAWLQANGYGRVVGNCRARIRGGWQRGDDVGHYGVTLDVWLK